MLKSKPHSSKVKYAELKFTAMLALATNNVSFLFMDTLAKVCADVFSDSVITRDLSVTPN